MNAPDKRAVLAHLTAQLAQIAPLNVTDEAREMAAHAAAPSHTTGPWPLTTRSLARLRELVCEAGAIAASVRDSGPVDVRFEASNLLCGLGDVDELLRDLNIALQMAESEAA